VGIEREFDDKLATKELLEYQKDGPIKSTQILIDALIAEGVSEATLLDIGGGIGAIQHELLKAGASSSMSVEASRAYVEVMQGEAERQGHADQIRQVHGNFVDLAADLPQFDIVTLDRVICCYHDVQSLLEKSLALTRDVYGLVFPLVNWKAKIAGFLENVLHRLHRCPFRFFLHPPEVIEDTIHSRGFERRFYKEQGIWQIAIYVRTHA